MHNSHLGKHIGQLRKLLKMHEFIISIIHFYIEIMKRNPLVFSSDTKWHHFARPMLQ